MYSVVQLEGQVVLAGIITTAARNDAKHTAQGTLSSSLTEDVSGAELLNSYSVPYNML